MSPKRWSEKGMELIRGTGAGDHVKARDAVMVNLSALDKVLLGPLKLCLLAPSSVWCKQEAARSLAFVVKVNRWEN
jgi:hypothetical protein